MKIASGFLVSTIFISACGGGSSGSTASDNLSSESPVQPVSVSEDSASDNPDTSDVAIPPDSADTDLTPPPDDTSVEQDPDESVTPYAGRATDPVWRVCDVDTGTNSRSSWQSQRTQSGNYRDCIKACPTDNSFIPDPSFPGLGWNDTLSTACAVVSTVDETGYHYAVPLYLPDQQPARQTFTNISAYQMHAGGGKWQCTHQQRRLSSDPFTDTGVTISYQFFSDGRVNTQNNATSDSTSNRWWFDGYTGTRVIGLPTNTTNENALPQRYIGNIKVEGNNMQIYRTTVDRLSCTSERNNDALAGYPDSSDQLSIMDALSFAEVLGRPLSCRAYESLSLSLDGLSFTDIGNYSNLESTPQEVFVTINQSASIDSSEQTRYEFQSNSTTTYTVNDDHVFDSTYRIAGDVARSFAFHLIDFRRFKSQIVMTDRYSVGGSGSSSIYTTYSLCSDVQ